MLHKDGRLEGRRGSAFQLPRLVHKVRRTKKEVKRKSVLSAFVVREALVHEPLEESKQQRGR